jgi:hypothetical protein
LCDTVSAADDAVLTTAAPDQAALLWKLERLFGPQAREDGDSCDMWCGEWIDALMADARRLLVNGRA